MSSPKEATVSWDSFRTDHRLTNDRGDHMPYHDYDDNGMAGLGGNGFQAFNTPQERNWWDPPVAHSGPASNLGSLSNVMGSGPFGRTLQLPSGGSYSIPPLGQQVLGGDGRSQAAGDMSAPGADGTPGVFGVPLSRIYEEDPRLGYSTAMSGLPRNMRDFFQNRYSSVMNEYLGSLGNYLQQGGAESTAPTWSSFLGEQPFQQRFRTFSPTERFGSGQQRRFAPRAQYYQ